MAQDPITYRYPRTLEQAFGPSNSKGLKQEGGARRGPFFDSQDRPVMVTIAVCVFSLAAALMLGWQP